MLRSAKKLIGFNVIAAEDTAGEPGGVVEDFYLDPDRWVVRYVVIDTGPWMDQRKVLVATRSLSGVDEANHLVRLGIELERIKGSPAIDLDQPLSRQLETDLHGYYGWPFYWMEDEALGTGSLAAVPLADLAAQMQETAAGGERPAMSSVFRFKDLHQLQLQARDGEIGSIDDLIVEEETWKIPYLVVDTGGWLGGRRVLVSPSWTQAFDWPAGKILVDLKRETIENSPEYDPSTTLGRDYEARLYQHYGAKPYWDDQETPGKAIGSYRT